MMIPTLLQLLAVVVGLIFPFMKNPHALVLGTKPYAKDSTWISWWCILTTALLLVAATVETLLDISLSLKLVCSVLAGLLSLRLFVIYHDQQHHAILPNSKLAEFLMRLVGLWALSPSSIWRSSHNHHHKHNSKLKGSNIGSYPIMTKEQFLKSSRADRIYYLFMRHPLTILFGYLTVFLYGMAIYPFFNSPREHFDCLLSLLLHIAVAVLVTIFFGWTGLILALIIPRFIACAMGSYLFYAQHNFPGVSFKDKAGWTYEKAALESSSYLKTSALMGWFTANIGYHHIHHLNHRVPFYRLPEVFQNVPALQTPRTTSLNPIDIIRCLRLKVWDVKTQQMVGL
jgi:acyl-lipid omega-6 desaturase (Delta-12 desaturase)